jgi:hypothetical protein
MSTIQKSTAYNDGVKRTSPSKKENLTIRKEKSSLLS